jgi:hypothetical protein
LLPFRACCLLSAYAAGLWRKKVFWSLSAPLFKSQLALSRPRWPRLQATPRARKGIVLVTFEYVRAYLPGPTTTIQHLIDDRRVILNSPAFCFLASIDLRSIAPDYISCERHCHQDWSGYARYQKFKFIIGIAILSGLRLRTLHDRVGRFLSLYHFSSRSLQRTLSQCVRQKGNTSSMAC